MTELHFTIGPVQGFIGAARRTRDLWAGSFLLSWLTAHAMARASTDGGVVILPAVYDQAGDIVEPMLKAVLTPPDGISAPYCGSLPNHFQARLGDRVTASDCRAATLAAWRKLAGRVWTVFIHPALEVAVADGAITRRHANAVAAIWDSQIPQTGDTDPFWEFTWVDGSEETDWREKASWLDRRKVWRSHFPPAVAPADRCFMIPDFAELSGFIRAHDPQRQDAFWQAMRQRISDVVYPSAESPWLETLELRENERLCAVALVKRLFPLLPAKDLKDAIGWIPAPEDFPPGASERQAEHALRNWPSTAFMSAVAWIARAGADPDKAAIYAEAQKKILQHGLALAERPQHHKIKALSSLRDPDGKPAEFAVLDGGLFFPRTLEANRYAAKDDPGRAKKAKALVANFDTFRGAQPPPSPFYAMLFMDGDGLGRAIGEGEDRARKISTGLADFASGVTIRVRDHDGVTLYAGGDDVAALFPLEAAIDAALDLREAYRAALAGVRSQTFSATISAGLVFADFLVPLNAVRDEARRLLDKVAKERTGRDAIAISILKPGGRTAEWAAKFEAGRLEIDGATVIEESPASMLLELARAMGQQGHEQGPVARRLAYVLQDRLRTIVEGGLSQSELRAFIGAELRDSGRSATNVMTGEAIDGLVSRLAFLCAQGDRTSFDPLIIARFLASDCLWPDKTSPTAPGATP